jgi:hypothetical protein
MLGGVEGAVCALEGRFCGAPFFRSVLDDHLMLRKPDDDRNIVAIAMLTVMAGKRDDDVTRDDSIEHEIELFPTLLDVRRKRGGVIKVSKRNVNRRLHRSAELQVSCDVESTSSSRGARLGLLAHRVVLRLAVEARSLIRPRNCSARATLTVGLTGDS